MTRSITAAVEDLKSSIRHSLSPDLITRACIEAGHQWRERTLNPVTTIWMFTLQILHGNTSCQHAVKLVPEVSATDGAYCQARARIPLSAFEALVRRTTELLLRSIDVACERWHGHRVFFIDGSSCTMPDTPELQSAFGQPTGQEHGCGFPMANLVGLFHRSGLLVKMIVNPLYTSEARIASQVFDCLLPGDVLVGDRAYSSYVNLALLRRRELHAVVREHARRPVDFRRGRRIAKNDQIIVRAKPARRPHWMTEEQFDRLPDRLELRQLRYRVATDGYRSDEVVLITTLLDAEAYPLEELAQLYGERWEAETCLRHLKQTMGMDMLRCKTASGVRKELAIYAVAYNLVRSIMVRAGINQGVPPNRISLIDVIRWICLGTSGARELPHFVVNPRRPGRTQPRAVKRRLKQYARLTHPRSEMRKVMETWIL